MISILVGTAAFTAGPALSLAGTQRAQPVMQSVNWDRHAGGCTPFAEFSGGGSAAVSSGVQAKWAQGGDNHMRRANPTDTHMVNTYAHALNPRLRMAHADLVRPH